MNLKRLWDTEGKKMVWAIPTWDPHKKLQVWTNDDWSKLYVYDIAWWREIAQSTVDAEEYWPVWKELEDEMVGYYLTNVPTDLYNWDSGDEVAYRFMNWTTVLQSWKVDEWETPEYTGDTPTKAATAQYTYTFSWWKPTVWPISKKTDFKAQFTSTVNNYDVTIEVNNTENMELDLNWTAFQSWDTISVPYGTSVSANGNVLTIGTNVITATVVTAWYDFIAWWGEMFWPLPQTITEDTIVEAECSPWEPISIAFQDYGEDEADGLLQLYPIQEWEEGPITWYVWDSHFTYNWDLADLSLDLVGTAEWLSWVTFNTDLIATEYEWQYYATVSTDDTEHVWALGPWDYVCKFNVVWQHNEWEPMTIGTLTVNINAWP